MRSLLSSRLSPAIVAGIVGSLMLACPGYSNAATIVVIPGTHPYKQPQTFPQSDRFPGIKYVRATVPPGEEVNKVLVDYDGTFGFLTGGPTLEDSVNGGVPTTLGILQTTEGRIYVIDLSQGSIVGSLAQEQLSALPDAASYEDRITFVHIANPMAKKGLMPLLHMLFGSGIPGLGIPFYHAADYGNFETVEVVKQYDAVGFSPQRLTPFAIANLIAGFALLHGDYSDVSLDPNDPRNVSYKIGKTTYIVQLQKELPIVTLARMILKPLGLEVLADIVGPALKFYADNVLYDPIVPPGATRIEPSSPAALPALDVQETRVFGQRMLVQTAPEASSLPEPDKVSVDVEPDVEPSHVSAPEKEVIDEKQVVSEDAEDEDVQEPVVTPVKTSDSEPEAPAVSDEDSVTNDDVEAADDHKSAHDTKKPAKEDSKSTGDATEPKKPKAKDDDDSSPSSSSAASPQKSASHDSGGDDSSSKNDSKSSSSSEGN